MSTPVSSTFDGLASVDRYGNLAPIVVDRLDERYQAGGEAAADVVNAVVADPATPAGSLVAGKASRSDLVVDVRDHGASPAASVQAATDQTAAFGAAISTAVAAGRPVTVPSGVWGVSGLTLPAGADVRLRLDPGATLVHLTDPRSLAAVNLNGASLTIDGGRMDGQQEKFAAAGDRNRHLIRGEVLHGQHVRLHGVHVRGSMQTIIDCEKLGGLVEMTGCTVRDQAEHTGIMNEHTMLLRVSSGEAGSPGLVRFNHNMCFGTATPRVAGGAPGGIFGFCSINPGAKRESTEWATGNGSAIEAIGNTFHGYGQHPPAQNVISPIHCYPGWKSVRVIGNEFRASSCAAVTVKATDVITVQGNHVMDGVVAAGNTNSQGAIDIVAGFMSGTAARGDVTVTGNVVRDPGGETETDRCIGIQVRGLSSAPVERITITGNTVSEAGSAVRVMNARDGVITGNVLRGGALSTTGTDRGVEVEECKGTVIVSGNLIDTPNGEGVRAFSGSPNLFLSVQGNVIRQGRPGSYAVMVRGIDRLHLDGNTLDARAVPSQQRGVFIGRDLTGGKHVGAVHWADQTILGGATVTITPTEVGTVSGRLALPGAPDPALPAEVGTTWTQTDAPGASVVHVRTAAGWQPLGGAQASGGSYIELLPDPVGRYGAHGLTGTATVTAGSTTRRRAGRSTSTLAEHSSSGGVAKAASAVTTPALTALNAAAWLYVPTDNPGRVQFRLVGPNGARLPLTVTPQNAWQRVTLTAATPEAGEWQVYMYAGSAGYTPADMGTRVWVDSISLTPGPAPQEPADGDTPDSALMTHEWTGTPGASTSTHQSWGA